MPAAAPFTGIPQGGNKPIVGGTMSGYKDCTLTWYDPALGGTNSGNGQANPHATTASGEPYDATKYTCAAPPEFPFGEYIRIFVGKKNCQVKVNDRGGAIQTVGGVPHFDLSRAAAETLGIISAGSSDGKYKKAAVKYAGPGAGPGLGPDLGGILGDIASPFTDIASAISFLFSKQFLYVVGGGILLLVAIVMVFLRSGGGDKVAAVASKIPPVE